MIQVEERPAILTSVAAAPKFLLVGDPYTLILSGEQTGGLMALFHGVVSPGLGPPPHVHRREDETFYVLSGEMTFYVDEKATVGRAGTVVHLPRNVPHYFRNTGIERATFLVEVTPGGSFDNYVRTVGEPLPVDYEQREAAPPTPEHIQKVLAEGPRFGIEFLL